MGKNKTNNKQSTSLRRVRLGSEAYSFYDASLGLQISRGEVKELKPNQLNSIKVRRAITAGHLEYVTEQETQDNIDEDRANTLNSKLEKLYSEGMEPSKIAKAFTLEELSLIASEVYGIEAEEGDTVDAILAAIIEEIESNKQ